MNFHTHADQNIYFWNLTDAQLNRVQLKYLYFLLTSAAGWTVVALVAFALVWFDARPVVAAMFTTDCYKEGMDGLSYASICIMCGFLLLG